jgi:NAD(P)-dependent dehydrogenase (short-subunit alcohol dehydrogenase family)
MPAMQPVRMSQLALFAVVELTRTLAAEWGPRGVRVNPSAPGYIWRAMTWKAVEDGWLETEAIVARTPLRRFRQVEDLVGPAISLASDEAAFISGQILPVDGSFLVHGYAKKVKQ